LFNVWYNHEITIIYNGLEIFGTWYTVGIISLIKSITTNDFKDWRSACSFKINKFYIIFYNIKDESDTFLKGEL